MRPETTGRWNAAWDFLSDVGPTRQMGIGVVTQQQPPQPAAPSTSAGAVTIKK